MVNQTQTQYQKDLDSAYDLHDERRDEILTSSKRSIILSSARVTDIDKIAETARLLVLSLLTDYHY